MKDILLDLIQHTYGLGVIDLVKITGSNTETVMNAVAEDRSVILNCKFKNPVAGFDGVFGMPTLAKLKTILSFGDEYDDNAKISVTVTQRNGVNQASAIHFENKTGDFINDFRLMSKELVEERVRNVTFKGATWNADFEPTVYGVGRLKKQASVHSDESAFTTKSLNGNLHVHFGEPSSHSGNFVFHSGTNGNLSKSIMWPVKQFLSIMDLPGDKHVYISDAGVMRITVDSGLADYEYLLPART